MFCLVGCLQCRRCILQTPIDSKRSTHHRDAPQHSMLVTAWMNYKYTASYFQVSLSSNGIMLNGIVAEDQRYQVGQAGMTQAHEPVDSQAFVS